METINVFKAHVYNYLLKFDKVRKVYEVSAYDKKSKREYNLCNEFKYIEDAEALAKKYIKEETDRNDFYEKIMKHWK